MVSYKNFLFLTDRSLEKANGVREGGDLMMRNSERVYNVKKGKK